MKLVVNSDEKAIAVIDWDGPAPRKGDYVKVPGTYGTSPGVPAGLREVRYAVWHVLSGEPVLGGMHGPSDDPFIEVMVE